MALEQSNPKHVNLGTPRIWAERARLAASVLDGPKPFYWRARWPWDARAAGLVIFGESWLNREWTDNKGTREVAPALVGLTIRQGGRTYLVKPLPMQTLAMYEQAAQVLRFRWQAVRVNVSVSTERRNCVVIDVETGDSLEQVVRYGGA